MPNDVDPVVWLFGPMTYSVWWIVGAVLVVLLAVAWVVAVIVWTMPVEVLRDTPVIRSITHRVLRFKFARALNKVDQRHRAGQLATREAFHEVSRIFRRFIVFRTGYAAREMTATDVAQSPLAESALHVLSLTYPGQFDDVDPRTLPAVVEAARTAVTAWR